MKTTPFTPYHIRNGARMAGFAGYDMPIEFTGINDEHTAVRARAGVFDVSHMGEIWVKGPRALDLLRYVGSNDAASLYDGKIQYSCLPNGRGGIVDDIIMFVTNIFTVIPSFVLLILISFALGKGFWGVTIGVALTHWPSLARILRAEILQCASSDFVAAAARLGAGRLAIAARHMVPYVLPQFVVGLGLLFPHAILHEAAITFLGFGLPPEMPAIGIILSEAMGYLSAGLWWLAVFPGLALVVCVMLFDVVGTSLRKLVDPAYAQE